MSAAAGARKFVRGAASRFGGADVLVANAGGPPRGRFEDFGDDDWRAAFELGVMGAVRLVREALPHMRARGGGRILFILSSSAREPIDDLLLSNVMRPAWRSRSPAPWGRRTSWSTPSFPASSTRSAREGIAAAARRLGISFEEAAARAGREAPLGRLGAPEEFGAMVAFLASPEASYVSGGAFAVDGGRLRGI